MKKAERIIDWEAVWKKFDKWYKNAEDHCTWESEMRAVERYVEKQLREKYDF